MSVGIGPASVTSGVIMELDASNPKSFSPNVFPAPLDAFSWMGQFGGYQMTLTRDATVTDSPVGGIPMKIVTSGTAGYTGSYNATSTNLAPTLSGQTWTVSFWVKASATVACNIFIFGANSAGNYIELGAPAFTAYTGWTRVSGTYTMANALTVFTQMRIDCYINGTSLWIDGLQVERSSVATPFNSKTNTNGVNWYDLTGNGYNAVLTGGPTLSTNKALQFNGSNYAQVTSINLVSGTYTIMGAARYSGATNGRMITAISNNWLMGHWSNSVASYYATGWVTGAGAGGSDQLWRIYAATGNTTSGVYQLYINGVLNTSGAGGTTGPNGLQVPQAGGEQSVGECAFITAYNRVLTADEIFQSYTALRGRFGI